MKDVKDAAKWPYLIEKEMQTPKQAAYSIKKALKRGIKLYDK